MDTALPLALLDSESPPSPNTFDNMGLLLSAAHRFLARRSKAGASVRPDSGSFLLIFGVLPLGR
ncbi:MAG: hypothetical protein ACFB0G_14475 [Leptolyngbyaceae cyanobacterium]